MPPLVSTAVKVMDAPAQVGLDPEVIEVVTVGITPELKEITMAFDVTDAPEVMIQVTVSLVKEEDE